MGLNLNLPEFITRKRKQKKRSGKKWRFGGRCKWAKIRANCQDAYLQATNKIAFPIRGFAGGAAIIIIIT